MYRGLAGKKWTPVGSRPNHAPAVSTRSLNDRLGRRDRRIVASAAVQRAVFRDDAPYSANQRYVALAIADSMRDTGGTGRWTCSVAYSTLALKTGLSESTIKRAVSALRKAEQPIFTFQKAPPGVQRGYTITLVLDPVAYANTRDRRVAEREAIRPDDAEHWRTFGRTNVIGRMVRTRQVQLISLFKQGLVEKSVAVAVAGSAATDAAQFISEAERLCATPTEIVAGLEQHDYLYCKLAPQDRELRWRLPEGLLNRGHSDLEQGSQ
jgi:hypothetical protein